ncbi:alpha/beta fold hydrolase [Angustibacter aerolatus]
MSEHSIETDGATITYDVHPARDGSIRRPPLVMVGQPMTAEGFGALAARFGERTVVTYDPRGLGRSRRHDGRMTQDPVVQAGDVLAVIGAVADGPVEVFASSGGAVTALALVERHPDAVSTLVAHEPPLVRVLPDAEQAERALLRVREAYLARGRWHGMAAFLAMTAWQGPFDERFAGQPVPDPSAFGMPGDDDGARDDELLSDRGAAVTTYLPDAPALQAAATRVVVAVGAESAGTFTGRTSEATAELLGRRATVFPSHHGGFLDPATGYGGDPDAFAARLREVLDAAA